MLSPFCFLFGGLWPKSDFLKRIVMHHPLIHSAGDLDPAAGRGHWRHPAAVGGGLHPCAGQQVQGGEEAARRREWNSVVHSV